MRAMKESGIEWIGAVPANWNFPPLRSKYSFGKGLSITKADLTDQGVPVISYGQIHSKGNIGVTVQDELIRFIPTDHSSISDSSKARFGDLIFADTSEDLQGCGNCVYVDREGIYAGYHTLILKPKASNTGRYYAYLFAADAWRAQVREKVSGVKLYSITQDILKNTYLLEPPADEQERIVDYLDTKCASIDALIAAKERTNALLKERRQSIIFEAVTKGLNPNVPMKDSGVAWIGLVPEVWRIAPLKYFATIQSGFTLGRQYAPEKCVEYSYLRVANVQGEYTDLSDVATIMMPPEEAEQYKLHSGELLMTEGGDRDKLGRGSIWWGEIADCLHQNHIFAVATNAELLVEYLNYLTTSDVGRQYFDFSAKKTTNLASTNSTTIMSFRIPIPSVNDQQRIVTYLNEICASIDALIQKNTNIVVALREYRQSLIYEAVTGKIEV